ncbi:HAMP domain-containing sensor histidine kinase [Pelagicoccus sp. SDUM812003]|uniref:sensor histidine kinase n=1 Tax=Pelagicoccus sp. SDUM812003 TaxID=3041267 RepID=UPI0028108B8C|nr:HAMP domain-containing sensor histidine kinase [Pelagicoccus sp. SDUM812003]MDQ8203565.1 HAMP domain-containing sensor histidine kinase [Pelagicoccus sp. SDUM812003]
MKPSTKSTFVWILLAASALCLAGLTLFSLYREKHADSRRRTELISQQELRLSEKLAAYFSEIQLQIARQLIGYHQEGLASQLDRWAKTAPIIRNARILPPQTDLAPFLQGDGQQTIALESPDAPAILRSGYYQDNKEIALHDEGAIDPILFWAYRSSENEPAWVVGHRMAKGQPPRIVTLDTETLLAAFHSLLDELAIPGLSASIQKEQASDSVSLSSILPGYSLQLSLAPDPESAWLSSFRYSLLVLTLAIGLLCSFLIVRQVSRDRRDALRKTTFVSQISHEFKTPLTSISLYSDLLSNENLPPEKRQRYLDTISRESHRLSEMVDNILALNALELGKKRYRIQTFDPAAAISQILSDHQRPLETAGLTIEWEAPGERCQISFDPAALRQILLNLLDNARKYAAGGQYVGIHLHCSARCRILVEDRGPGIPSSQRDQIFEAFYQEQSTLTDKSPGAGIGLSISRRMARDCRGDLSLDTKYTEGARFILELPLATPS